MHREDLRKELRTLDPEAAAYADWRMSVDDEAYHAVYEDYKKDSRSKVSFEEFMVLWFKTQISKQ